MSRHNPGFEDRVGAFATRLEEYRTSIGATQDLLASVAELDPALWARTVEGTIAERDEIRSQDVYDALYAAGLAQAPFLLDSGMSRGPRAPNL